MFTPTLIKDAVSGQFGQGVFPRWNQWGEGPLSDPVEKVSFKELLAAGTATLGQAAVQQTPETLKKKKTLLFKLKFYI